MMKFRQYLAVTTETSPLCNISFSLIFTYEYYMKLCKIVIEHTIEHALQDASTFIKIYSVLIELLQLQVCM